MRKITILMQKVDTRGRFYCACPCVCWGGINWADVTYSALLGGLSSGIFELSPSISTNNQNNKLNPNEVISGIWEDSPNKAKNIVEKSQLENVENVGERKYNDSVIYRRVQGGIGNNASQKRIIVNSDGSISIPNKIANLSISVDEGEHAKYFLNKRGYDANIVEIDIPKWFDDFLNETAIPQVNYKRNLLNQGETAPKITDITTPGKSFEIPPPWIEWLEEYGKNAKEIYF